MGRWCGDRIPREYTSLSNEVLVVFRTDSSYGYDGFRLKYETRMYQTESIIFFKQFFYIERLKQKKILSQSLWWKIRCRKWYDNITTLPQQLRR